MDLHAYHQQKNSEHEVAGSVPSNGGVCPGCGRVSAFLQICSQMWAVCHACKKAWHASSSRSGDNGKTTEEDWKRNRETLDGFEIVEPAPSSLTKMINEQLISAGLATRR